MKKLYIVLMVIGLMLTSCELETSNNGDLDGYWHLVRVDTLATGGVCDMSEARVFWGVQVRLIEAVDHDNDSRHYGYLFKFEKKESMLRLYYAHRHNREEGDILVEDVREISSLGVNSLDDTFLIEQLNSSNMTIVDDLLRLSFVKM